MDIQYFFYYKQQFIVLLVYFVTAYNQGWLRNKGSFPAKNKEDGEDIFLICEKEIL